MKVLVSSLLPVFVWGRCGEDNIPLPAKRMPSNIFTILFQNIFLAPCWEGVGKAIYLLKKTVVISQLNFFSVWGSVWGREKGL